MKYVSGGITANLGQAVVVEVPVAAKAGGGAKEAATDKKADEKKPDSKRLRLSAWTRTRDLFYSDPKKGGKVEWDRAAKYFDACAGKVDDLIILQTINIQNFKEGRPLGKVVWDSDFYIKDSDAPEIASRLCAEGHKRGIAIHAGYAVVDEGTASGVRGQAFKLFMEKGSADQIKEHATACVDILKLCKFDGLSFDLEINGLSTAKHAANIEALFKALASQMAGDNMILSYAPYPFLTDGNAPSLPNMNAVPYSLAKIGKNVIARPQAYRGAGESMGAFKGRLEKTIKCALEDVGLPPAAFQIGVDYTGDSTFAAVRGDDMTDACKMAKAKGIGLVIWRMEWPGSPSADNLAAWDKAMNDGASPANTEGEPIQCPLTSKVDGTPGSGKKTASADDSPSPSSGPSGAKESAAPAPAPDTESADWRPHIGKDSVPDNVLEAVRKNRAKYPSKTLPKVSSGKYAGEHHYDYKPPDDHYQWAKDYFSKKLDSPPGGNKNVVKAFLLMLRNEGRPASFQTYDNQIITWGVGLGGKGDGVHAFEHMNKDANMKKLLDDLGVQYFDGDYHVVDLDQKKVVSSSAGKKGDDNRHIVALESWRHQPDLMSAIIGISEDPKTREAVAESQYQVYLSNSTRWGGQDKVFTLALYFMITHMYQWLPAIAKYGFDVAKEFAAIGGGTPSVETDKKLAPRIALAFIRQAKKYSESHKLDYDDVRTRTKTRLWKQMREDGKAEGFDPGELEYED